MSKMILIRGLPGSGKSTLARSLCVDDNWCHYEADMYFYVNDHYVFDRAKIKYAHKWCFDATNQALFADHNVIVSNTFTMQWELQSYFDLAKSYGIVPQVLLCQNNYGSIHGIPDEDYARMKNRFEFDLTELFASLSD